MNTSYIEEIAAFVPHNTQEATDQRLILEFIRANSDAALTRDSTLAHITSSGFLVSENLARVLMVHHNILGTWAWTGGHADGDANLRAVAVREAIEETGAQSVRLLSPRIASLDILTVASHVRRGQYVNAHLHLSVAYILLCDEDAPLRVKPDENSGVRWFSAGDVASPLFSPHDAYLYGKLLRFARACRV